MLKSSRVLGVAFRGIGLMALLSVSLLASAKSTVHPAPLTASADSSTCLQCHAELNRGKYVHGAMAMGCTRCHAVKISGGETQVVLVSPGNQLCFTCHEKSNDPVQHQPYGEGLCTVCHSPHASNFPAHLWVGQQEICMGCHVKGLPKVNQTKKTVSVPWGRSLTFKQMDRWYYIGLDPGHTKNHPVEGHPVMGPNTLVAGSPAMSCLSCHQAHTSKVANLIPPQFPQQEQLCVSCHTNM
jgi:predicted CXXCH cytochrome family protein